MKSMGNDSTNNSKSSNNWLDFSLSPDQHMNHNQHNNNMEEVAPPPSNPPHSSSSALIPAASFHPHSPFSYSGFYCGENGGPFYSPLSVMPLKSDGSLCLMEAMTRSQQPQGMVTSATPKLEDFFGSSTMVAHHHPYDQLNQVQHYPEYPPAFRGHELYRIPEGETNKETQLVDGNVWVSRNYLPSSTQGMEQQKMIGNINVGDVGGSMGYGDLQYLSLSMSPGSQSSSCVTGPQQISPTTVTDCLVMDTKKRGSEKVEQKQIVVHRKSIDTFGQRTSQYRGVTRHRWTGRYEAHLWDNSCKKEGQSRKGRQVYLGGYDMEEKAARAYDSAALKYWGPSTHINFPLENYHQELEDMKNMTRQEYVAHLRRKSSGFSRGASMYRGVTRHHQHGRWQARIGRVAGNKDLYLGTFSTQEEAAEAYDVAAIKFRGTNAVTNFDITRYDVERIMASNTLLAGEMARRIKVAALTNPNPFSHSHNTQSCVPNINNASLYDWKMSLNQSFLPDNKQAGAEDFLGQSFSATGHDLLGIGIESMSTICHDIDEVSKMGTPHLSNASSLVTSLSSSREGSPDKTNTLPMLFGMPTSAAKFVSSSTNTTSSWISTAQLEPHVPVFAAWTDA